MTQLPRAVVESHRVLIGDTELTWPIEDGGVEVLPGGHNGLNRLRVTFFCSEIEVKERDSHA